MKLSDYTISLLNDIEQRIDEETEQEFLNDWRNFLYGKYDGDIFYPKRKKVSKPGIALKDININDAINDYELMLDTQLAIVSKSLNSKSNVLAVRANYGTGILSSLFGADIFMMPYTLNTLPTTKAFNSNEKIKELIQKGIPALNIGFGKQVFNMGEIYKEVFSKYPKISKYVYIYHPDLQGPLDICELLWGCEMFYAMYDEDTLVHDMLSLITNTYISFMDEWFNLFPLTDDINAHWFIMFKGNILLRNDSAMNLSPGLYKEYAFPYDSKLLDYYNGGVIHFCGKGDHYIEIMSQIPKLTGINMSQPHLNNMEKIYMNTIDKGLMIIDYIKEYAQQDKVRPGGFKGRVQVRE